jgi:hypothetical protein
MVKIASDYLTGAERLFLRKYANYVLQRYVRPSVLRKSNINIRIITKRDLADSDEAHDLKESKAWCIYDGIFEDKKRFSIVLSAHRINRKAKKPWVKLKNIMFDLSHELIHVKQYLNGELFDYVSGEVRYKGELFTSKYQYSEEAYFESPWEIEAYGREWGLYKMYVRKLKNEIKMKEKDRV